MAAKSAARGRRAVDARGGAITGSEARLVEAERDDRSAPFGEFRF